MTEEHALLPDLQAFVDAHRAKWGVPALSVAIWHKGTLTSAAAGTINIVTALPVSTDSIFQIGSISKVFTTSLIMMLVDQGKIDLDAPIKAYLKHFHVADELATRTITLRHLLSHTSGIESDFFTDDRWDEGNPIASYVDRCFFPQVHMDFGKRFSY